MSGNAGPVTEAVEEMFEDICRNIVNCPAAKCAGKDKISPAPAVEYYGSY
jgi:hypothetical protein